MPSWTAAFHNLPETARWRRSATRLDRFNRLVSAGGEEKNDTAMASQARNDMASEEQWAQVRVALKARVSILHGVCGEDVRLLCAR